MWTRGVEEVHKSKVFADVIYFNVPLAPAVLRPARAPHEEHHALRAVHPRAVLRRQGRGRAGDWLIAQLVSKF